MNSILQFPQTLPIVAAYAGVGSRKTPPTELEVMYAIACKMSRYGYWLHSGGADGADKAFERGAGTLKKIFFARDATNLAMEIASYFHPRWQACKEFARKLHGRNSFQILGHELAYRVAYCICWTPDGVQSHAERSIKTGGTGTAISIADHFGIPVINLARPEQLKTWGDWAYTP